MRGRRQTAGQAVRVIDLPADVGAYGLFETLHDFADAASFADHLRSASSEFYGTAARAFIESIATDLDAVATLIKAADAQFVAEQCGEDADGQVKRVAYRFGLIAAAGELATSLKILPWQPRTALDAATKCFQAWLNARGGKGVAEEKDGIAAVRTFLSAHMLSRFLPAWEPSEFEPKILNLAGYRKRADDDPDAWDFFVTSEAWSEVAAGFNKTALAEALARKGYLVSGTGGKRSKVLKFPGIGDKRVYHIRHTIFLDDAGD
jgi:putative DNA primase/helicase